jgi:tetratricopeptide (TPR) repeat protein
LSAAELETMYRKAKARATDTNNLSAGALVEIEGDLRTVADRAADPHLRANASLLLGSILEAKGDLRSAISFYRQAHTMVADEPEPIAVLAMALAQNEDWAEAIELQRALIEKVPDDLEARLLLGEMLVKSGQKDAAVEAYAQYELRRKGLIDGLTGTKEDGGFLVSPDERAACARALAPAADNGTALALLTALRIEPEPAVRAEIVATMGQQRLVGYKDFLTRHRDEKEKDPTVLEAIGWALDEIERDPVDARPGVAPQPAEGAEAPDGNEEAAGEGGKGVGEKAPSDATPADGAKLGEKERSG